MRFDPLLSPNKSPASLPIPSFPPPFACPPFYPALTLLPYVLPSLRPSVHLHPPSPAPLHPKYLITFLLSSFYAPTTGSNTHSHTRTHTHTHERRTHDAHAGAALLRDAARRPLSHLQPLQGAPPPPPPAQHSYKNKPRIVEILRLCKPQPYAYPTSSAESEFVSVSACPSL